MRLTGSKLSTRIVALEDTMAKKAKQAGKKKAGTLEFACAGACLTVTGPGGKKAKLEFGFPITIKTSSGKSITVGEGSPARRKG